MMKKVFLSLVFCTVPLHLAATNMFFLLLAGLGFGHELYIAEELAPLKKQLSFWIKEDEIKAKDKAITEKSKEKENDSWEKSQSDKKEKIIKKKNVAAKRKRRMMRLTLSTFSLLLGLFAPPFTFDFTESISFDRHPKTQVIQFRDQLDDQQARFLLINQEFLPLFALFQSFVPGWQGEKEDQHMIDCFLTQRNTQAEAYKTLSSAEKKELFTWVYRQYWNCSKEQLAAFFKEEIKKSDIKKYPDLLFILTDFVSFLDKEIDLSQECIVEKAFCNCADQGKSADCGPYSLQTAIFLSQNQEDQLLNKEAYRTFTQRLRSGLVELASASTAAEKIRKQEGNLDEGELRQFIPEECKNIFLVDAEHLASFYEGIMDNPFKQAIQIFNTTGKVIILCNTKAHWLTIECTKTADDKIKVRAFDPGSAHEEDGNLKKSAIGATNIATTMLYAFIQKLKK